MKPLNEMFTLNLTKSFPNLTCRRDVSMYVQTVKSLYIDDFGMLHEIGVDERKVHMKVLVFKNHDFRFPAGTLIKVDYRRW